MSNEQIVRWQNYVYQILMETGERKFVMKEFDFERVRENRDFLLETKKTTYFLTSQVAKLVIFHEVNRTGSYELVCSKKNIATNIFQLFKNYIL